MAPTKTEQRLGRRTEMNREKWRWRTKSRRTKRLSPSRTPKSPHQLASQGQSGRIPHLKLVLRLPTPLMTTVSGSHSRRCSGVRFLLQRVTPPRTRYPLTIVTVRLTASSPTSRTTLRSLHRARAHRHSMMNKQKTLPMPYQRIPLDVCLPWFFRPYLEKAYRPAGTT